MRGIDGGTLRAWRRSRGWDVPEVARQLRYAARDSAVHVAAHEGLIRMIYAWERGDHDLSERYELLYRKADFPDPASNDEPEPQPTTSATGGQADHPVKRRTFVELTGISVIDALLKAGDQGLAHLAADRSMSAALASQDPLTVGASARIVTHALMNSGQLTAAISTARNYSLRLDREIKERTPEFLSVYGSVLLRGAIAAAQHDERSTAHEMLGEAAEAARRLGTDANLRGTAFGPVNAQLHQVNVAVTLGDAGTAVDLARRINLAAITVTERKASLLIDVARAFFQWGRYEQAYAALRAAEQTAPEEVAARPAVGALVRSLAALARQVSGGTPSSSPPGSARPGDSRWPRAGHGRVRCRPGRGNRPPRHARSRPRLDRPGDRHPRGP